MLHDIAIYGVHTFRNTFLYYHYIIFKVRRLPNPVLKEEQKLAAAEEHAQVCELLLLKSH